MSGPAVEARPSARPPSMNPPGYGDPCTLIILGGAGDLARRKLLPAVHDLFRKGLLAERFRVLGAGLEPHDDDSYREVVRESVEQFGESRQFDKTLWQQLAPRLHYVSGNLTQPELYRALADKLAVLEQDGAAESRNRLFYLAVPPSIFAACVAQLSASGLCPRTPDNEARPWARVIVEKPFGRSLQTARTLSQAVLAAVGEHQVYRIDHYLAKETVQNLLVFRAANLVIEPLWNRNFIAHVQITAAETVGVEQRGRYYEEAGVVRDMFQNHLLQLLSLTAMELPHTMDADAVRDEKVKALRAVRPLLRDGPGAAVRGQYTEGQLAGKSVRGYREEPNVAPDSRTPTYAAMRVLVDNPRWKGVPFYLRSGKRMAKRVTEIAVQFREPPHLIFEYGKGQQPAPNLLIIRVQPDEGISLRFEVKIPGAAMRLTPETEVCPVEMNFDYADAFGTEVHPAYETLLLDCTIGDATLFTRTDEVECAWRIVDPLLEYWDSHPEAPLASYPAGGWGPADADALLAHDGFRWREP